MTPIRPVSSRHETRDAADHNPATHCAAPSCTTTLTRTGRGRPARYCSPACRSTAHRALRRHRDQPIRVEIDHGSTSAKGRTHGRVWLIRLRRADRAVILTAGLDHPSAERLARQITHVLDPQPGPAPSRVANGRSPRKDHP
jgi:hypothetical protein